jgi:cellulose synthase (UDP-forming)
VTSFSATQTFPQRVFRFVMTCVALFLLFQFVSLYLSWPKQVVVGTISVLLVLVLNRVSKSRVVTVALMIVSLAATLRYGWWRVTLIIQHFSDETNHRITIDAVLMLVLLSAEAYTIFIMILGFMQTVAPLERRPIPLPVDESKWPHVDVLIPTYNEPLSLVRYTALAAINMDYPPRKLHVAVLDDGTREDFRLFCEEAGIGYVTREKHNHAKAGNINHALEKMDSPLVTIFDCDHVPTRSFLQVTVGWFLADDKLAMLQTPHFFYSADPFERNLQQYKTIPNEGELFYGVIQDGNDLWNATFFCGSCAVIRRTAMDEVGGIATETVTEDAHTSLKMQKKGWGTAYINLPQAAGLATETLSAHVGQRIRWARGMIQIFRTDNPMLASGMKFTQRLCYFNAMLHFLYAVPRLVFLCAPLVYMLGGRTIIPGYWVAILAYALPHLVISSLTNSRVQGKHRHSFWNEIYETVLAPYILMPTLLALINPKLGKFNVTDKGTTLEETRFDHHIAAPTTWLLVLNLIGVCVVPYRLIVTDPTHPGTVLSNLVWILFNMVILGVAAAVANEQQQRRTAVRIMANIGIRLRQEGVEPVETHTTDISVGGCSVIVPEGVVFEKGTKFRVSFPVQTHAREIGARVAGQYGHKLRLRFETPTIVEQETLTRAIYSRADSWITSRGTIEEDRPLVSLARVIRLSFTGFAGVLRGLLPKRKAVAGVAVALALMTAAALGQGPAVAPAAAPVADAPHVTEAEATDRISLKDMGVQSTLEMHGPHSYSALGFVLSNSRVPRRAQINLAYHFNSLVLPKTASIRVMMNGTPIGTIQAPDVAMGRGDFAIASFGVPSDLLIRNNELTFEFTGGTALRMETQTKASVLASIGATSTLLVVGDRIPVRRDLSLLPMPLFDPDLQTTTTIPFCFMSTPTPKMLEAAGIVASWFGVQQSAKPIHFSVSIGVIPTGDVIVFSDHGANLPATMQVPGGGASMSLKANPTDPDGSVLALAGDNDDQLLQVARSLALMTVSHEEGGDNVAAAGDSVRIGDFAMPAPRKPDDAPRWLMTDRLKTLFADRQTTMTSNGSQPLPVYFRLPPDLFYGETQNLNLKLSYRYNALAVAQGSALRLYVNGVIVTETQLAPGKGPADKTRVILLPTETLRPFGNTMTMNFDFVPANPNDTGQNPERALRGDILRDSALDIRGLAHWAAMPNLELFANAGFPFTRLADLADTTVIMPASPTPKEIALLLYLMSHFGTQTGYPSLRVEVAGPDVALASSRDYLILGNVADQPAFAQLENSLPVTFDATGVHVNQAQFGRLNGFLRSLQGLPVWQKLNGATNDLPSNDDGRPDLMIEGLESPTGRGRSIVLVELKSDDVVDRFAEVFQERSQSSDISQSVSLLRKTSFTSYGVPTPGYHVGYISWYALMRIWLAEHFWVLLVAMLLLCLLLGRWIHELLVYMAAVRLEPANKRLV